jgi:hypothetical protein
VAPPRKERRSAKRHYLGKVTGFGHVQRVYQTREAIEVDEQEGYDVVRRRVFYDDVLLVTYHRFIGRGFVIAMAILGGGMAVLAMLNGRETADATRVTWVLAAMAAPFVIALALRLALKVDAVTVYGRRTKAQVHFWVRKGRARRVFNSICRAVKETQDRLARELAASRPPAPAPGPLPPPPAA